MGSLKYLTWAVLVYLACMPPSAFSRTVKNVSVELAGASDIQDDPPSGGCRAFRPTAAQVRQYFSRAYPVPAKLGAHDRYSPCHAKGTVTFSDNTRGTWKLSSGGAATLFWDTGDVVSLFYGKYKWHDPFAGMYGLCDEGDC